MKLSIVTTFYYSASYIDEFYKRITSAANKITTDYEIIFVNDGSPDNSLEVSKKLYENDKKIKIIDLSKNFGHHKAMMTGMMQAKGDLVFLIDCDLEEEPELLNSFWENINIEKDIDVIFGVQDKRKGSFFERISGSIFYNLFNFFSDTKLYKNIVTVRIMKKRYVESLVKFKESELVINGLSIITGFNQKTQIIQKHNKSTTTYNSRKKINLAINSITSFSNKPLIFIFYFGMLVTSISLIFIIYLFSKKLFYGATMSGWTSTIASIWFIGGVLIFCIGIVGIYLSKIFIEVKNRPYTIIKDTYTE